MDPCGTYGAAADLKTFAAHGVHGMGVVTVVTAQNSLRWVGAEFMPAAFVGEQLEAVLTDYGAHAVKTGFLGRVDLIEVVAAGLRRHGVDHLVVDPVLVDGDGRSMFGPEVAAAYRELLIPLAEVVTPNRSEVSLLLGEPVVQPEEAAELAGRLGGKLGATGWFLLKGVLYDGRRGDLLSRGAQRVFLPGEPIDTRNVGGSGDTLSAALAARLAGGLDVPAAAAAAQAFTRRALEAASTWRLAGEEGPTANFLPAEP